MTQSNCTTAKRTFKHLTDIQRGRLEEMTKIGDYTQAEMAKELNITQSTISQELKRGRTRQMASNRTYYDRYLADAGARVYHDNRWYTRRSSLRNYLKPLFQQRRNQGSIVLIPLSIPIEKNIRMNMSLAQRLSIP